MTTNETFHAVAEAIAPTFERRRAEFEEFSAPVRRWMLRELAPREGDTVLELAAGVGETGFDAATLVGERGRLISTELSTAMLDAARRRGAARGVHNVEYRIVDAERIELDDDSVDGVLCRFGYMLMDPEAALAETRRVLRPGGGLALAVWGDMERNLWISIVALSLVEHGHIPLPDPPPAPGPFNLASAERITTLLRGAGFVETRTEEVPLRLAVPDVDQYMALIADIAGPIALALRDLSEADRAEIHAEVEDSLGRFTARDGYELPGVAVCAVAG
jgi:ubiquinone/menaquinone biosynthesis C-methylase UbiE